MSIESYLIELSKTYTPNTLLDIGAHHGNFSMFCKGVWKNIDSLMLEGNENCEKVLENLPFSHCIVLLSDTNKEVTLHLNPKNPTCTGTSYLKERTRNYKNSVQVKKNTFTLEEVVSEVDNKSFDIISSYEEVFMVNYLSDSKNSTEYYNKTLSLISSGVTPIQLLIHPVWTCGISVSDIWKDIKGRRVLEIGKYLLTNCSPFVGIVSYEKRNFRV